MEKYKYQKKMKNKIGNKKQKIRKKKIRKEKKHNMEEKRKREENGENGKQIYIEK